MSDQTPDRVDKAYVEAAAALEDEAARADRRARVLAAVAKDATAQRTPAARGRGSAWRLGGWLAAASVAGLSVLVATQLYRPSVTAPAPPAAAPSVLQASRSLESAAISPSSDSASPQLSAPAAKVPRAASPPPVAARDGPIVPPPPASPPPPAPVVLAPAPRAFPATPPQAPDMVTAGRVEPPASARAPAASVDATIALEPMRKAAPFADVPPPPPAPPAAALRTEPHDLAQPNQGAGLRAAAAAGRTAEVQSLLAQGAPIDAPDAEGNTALMESIQADHPAVAALLRRHGASLDAVNRSGERARDLAARKADPALNRALGLEP